MKIAYVVPYVPNQIRTRSYNLINQLSILGHEVSVFTLVSGLQDEKDAESLRSKISHLYYEKHPVWNSLWNGLTALPTQQPLQTVYSWNSRLAKQLIRLLSDQGRFDIVHVEHLRGSSYGRYVKMRLPRMPIVWDSVDCISYLFMQASKHSADRFGKLITRFELKRTRRIEGKLISEFDHILVTSKTDKKALLNLAPHDSNPSPISVLTNGVDMEYFCPNPDIRRDNETLVFSGKMSYHANISMVKHLIAEIMPRVWAKRSKVRVMIVGKDPSPEVRAMGNDPRISVTGTVEDIRPYLWESTVAVVPLVYGAGIQNKVLEAMACGTPVVTTAKTLSSLDVTPNKELVVADNADEFAGGILELLDNPGRQVEVSTNGLKYVNKFHNWTTIAGDLLTHYETVGCR